VKISTNRDAEETNFEKLSAKTFHPSTSKKARLFDGAKNI
jgi:hypothetical protein